MAYVNCGAYVNGVRPKTKKALKDAMANNPMCVTLDPTSAFDIAQRSISGSILAPNINYSVCGPDPYENRKWYANIKNGKVT